MLASFQNEPTCEISRQCCTLSQLPCRILWPRSCSDGTGKQTNFLACFFSKANIFMSLMSYIVLRALHSAKCLILLPLVCSRKGYVEWPYWRDLVSFLLAGSPSSSPLKDEKVECYAFCKGTRELCQDICPRSHMCSRSSLQLQGLIAGTSQIAWLFLGVLG